MEAQTFTFASSPFVPVAVGFCGLGTGDFISTPAPSRMDGWRHLRHHGRSSAGRQFVMLGGL
jgi:hypothetical protein